MKRLSPTKVVFASVFTCFFTFNAVAQTSDWLPIPFGQESYFIDVSNDVVTQLRNDKKIILNEAVEYRLYGQFLEDEFDTCSTHVWFPPSGQTLPNCQLQKFISTDSSLVFIHRQNYFSINLNKPVGSIQSFGSFYQSTYTSIGQETFLGVNDSVRVYTISEQNTGNIGVLKLSKKHGLIEFPDFKQMDINITAPPMLELLGFKDSLGANYGIQAPKKEDFYPYSLGDQLVFKHVFWDDNAFVTQFHYLTLTTMSDSALIGNAVIFNENGSFIRGESNYVLGIDPMLSELIDHFISVPFKANSDQDELEATTLFFYGTYGWSAMISGFEKDYCDKSVITGFGQSMFFDGFYGLYEKNYIPNGPITSWTLEAGFGENFFFSPLPDWVGINELNQTRVGLYPNPARDVLNLSSNATMASFRCTDITGALVLNMQITFPETLDISELNSGVYFIRMELPDGNVENLKFVKN